MGSHLQGHHGVHTKKGFNEQHCAMLVPACWLQAKTPLQGDSAGAVAPAVLQVCLEHPWNKAGGERKEERTG